MSQSTEEYCGWFTMPGQQAGRRSLCEQMLGLHPALAECDGKTALDLGCAEGLIALEFARAGATVTGFDYNVPMIETARALALGIPPLRRPVFMPINLNDMITDHRARGIMPHYDIVLALAILHKLGDPGAGAAYAADVAGELLVIRLPEGQDGTAIRGKHSGRVCNINKVIARRGFELEKTLRGPRHEAVCYWRRLVQPV